MPGSRCAAVDAMVMLRLGRQPDARITMRNVIHRRDLAALILIDLSESTYELVHGSTRMGAAMRHAGRLSGTAARSASATAGHH